MSKDTEIAKYRLIDGLLVRKETPNQKDMCPDRVTQIVVPRSKVKQILESVHDGRAHPGRDETHRQARMKYYWDTMRKYVGEYVKNCE